MVRKLSLLSLYLLFLSVQLNLKYTFSDSLFSDYSSYLAANSKASLEKTQDDKPVVQKLRLNKRYVHEDVFLIYSWQDEPVHDFYIKVDKTETRVPSVVAPTLSRALLRGPPHTTNCIS